MLISTCVLRMVSLRPVGSILYLAQTDDKADGEDGPNDTEAQRWMNARVNIARNLPSERRTMAPIVLLDGEFARHWSVGILWVGCVEKRVWTEKVLSLASLCCKLTNCDLTTLE